MLSPTNPIIIETPRLLVRDAQPVLVSAFNILNRPTPASVIGEVENKQLFSSAFPATSDEPVALYLKGPATDFYIPGYLQQFAPAVTQIVKHHYSRAKISGHEWCYAYIWQDVIDPAVGSFGETFKPHIDMPINDAVQAGAFAINDRYIVSDALPTIFFGRANRFSKREIGKSGIDWRGHMASRILAGNEKGYSFAPYSIVRFDSTTPHMARMPLDATCRTFLSIIFTNGACNPALLDESRYISDALQKQSADKMPALVV